VTFQNLKFWGVIGVYVVERIHAAIASRCSFHAGIRDAARQAYMVIRSRHC
jgi:hypothetical protein